MYKVKTPTVDMSNVYTDASNAKNGINVINDPTNPYAPTFKDWQLPFSMPGRVDMMNPDGTLKQQYQLDVTKARPESDWYKNEASLAENLYGRAKDEAAAANFAQVTGAQNNLAAAGGLSSGAAERLAQQGVQSRSNAMTGLANQHSQNLYGLRGQDIQNQINADQWNISNSINEVNNKYNADLGVFDIMAGAYGDNQLANAYADNSTPKNTNANTVTTQEAPQLGRPPKPKGTPGPGKDWIWSESQKRWVAGNVYSVN